MSGGWLCHNSHLLSFRSPFGAARCREEVALALTADKSRRIDKVLLRLWQNDREILQPMLPQAAADGRTAYHATIAMPEEPGIVWYYFLVYCEDGVWYYGNNGKNRGGVGGIYREPPPAYQITVYRGSAAVPEWFRRAVVYQIFVDRFYNGNPHGEITHVKPGGLLHAHWDDEPVYTRDQATGQILAYDFFGGNLAGVEAKLPYLKGLGVGAIYLNPIFESVSNHKYDTADYHNVDAMFGGNEAFRRLCRKARELGMAIILDGVFSHTGSDSVYFNREGRYPGPGAWQSAASPYFSWYRFTKHPAEYESWWGIETLPNVDELEPSYREFIIHGSDSVIRRWMESGAAGWRLDVADELPSQFIRELRQAVKEINPEAVVIGEVWEDASRKVSYGELRNYFAGDELDSVTNYPFRRIALDFLLGRENSQEIGQALLSLAENYPRPYFYAALNVIGSHDVPRILTVLGEGEPLPQLPLAAKMKRRLGERERRLAVERLKLLTVWQMTFPGVPCIYYGDEAGLEGYEDPLNRRTFPWGREDKELAGWYERLIALRNTYPVLVSGDWRPLDLPPEVYGHLRVDREGKAAAPAALVLLNRSLDPQTVEVALNLRGLEEWRDLLTDGQPHRAADGLLRLTLAPLSGKLLLAASGEKPARFGVLLHPASLPSRHGIGGFGAEARRFVDFLVSARQNCWQILPLNPVGAGNSPYRSVSCFAGEALLIDIEGLVDQGLLTMEEVEAARTASGLGGASDGPIDYRRVRSYKEGLFRTAFHRFSGNQAEEELAAFSDENSCWLEDYALYMALAGHFSEPDWTRWPQPVDRKTYAALLKGEIGYYRFLQYIFRRQWLELKAYANGKGVSIIGDLPIFAAPESVDVWANQELFQLDEAGRPAKVAGVPPDYFSAAGQLWGNPLYRWDVMAQDDYLWWRRRILSLLAMVDSIRLDHFRGFQAYWAVDAGEPDAVGGAWIKGPGEEFFRILEGYLGRLNVIAEDLGMITPDVAALRKKLGYPGMTVLQFAWEGDDQAPFFGERDRVMYTGTHDNDTIVGWYRGKLALDPRVAAKLKEYSGGDLAGNAEIAWTMIELAYQCGAGTVIIPLQDLLGLDSAARMNTPGTEEGNWQWRCPAGALTPELATRLGELVRRHGRL